MKKLEGRLSKATRVQLMMRFYDVALDAVIFLLFFTLLAQISNKSMIYILPLTILAVIADATIKLSKNKNVVDEIESREADFHGSLKTAYEHKGKRNVIVDDLLEKTSAKLMNLRYSVFLNQEGVAERITLAVIMAFIIISVVFVKFQDFMVDLGLSEGGILASARKTFDGTRDRLTGGGGAWEGQSDYANPDEQETIGGSGGGLKDGYSEGPLPGKGSGIGEELREDIYGKPGSANLWGKDISMEIHPEYGGDVDVEYTGGGRRAADFELGDIESVEQYNDYPVKQAELVKKYFEKIIEEGR